MKRALLIFILMICFFEGFSQQSKVAHIGGRTRKYVEKLQSDRSLIIMSGEKEYKWFKRFERSASVDELLTLMNHPSPLIRAYSFWALREKSYSDLENLANQHSDDNKETFRYNRFGRGSIVEIIEEETVSNFVWMLMNNKI